MNLRTKKYYYITIGLLILLLLLWMDKVFIITNPEILTYKYQIAKIILHTTLAYFLSKYIAKIIINKNYFKSINPKFVFLGLFLLFNSYIISQYMSRTISTNLINFNTRNSLATKLKKTDRSGTGYEGDNLTFNEYGEVKKYSNLLNLPKEAHDIYVYDWYGIQDYHRIVEFTVNPKFCLSQFYKDTTRVSKIEVLTDKYNQSTNEWIPYDIIHNKRYKWEVFEI